MSVTMSGSYFLKSLEKSEVKQDKVTIKRNENSDCNLAKGNQIDTSVIRKPKANIIFRLKRITV